MFHQKKQTVNTYDDKKDQIRVEGIDMSFLTHCFDCKKSVSSTFRKAQ